MVMRAAPDIAAQHKTAQPRDLFPLPSCRKLMQSAAAWGRGGAMIRELQLLTVSLVFLFLGAIVFGVIH
jgi:hypothetical protein